MATPGPGPDRHRGGLDVLQPLGEVLRQDPFELGQGGERGLGQPHAGPGRREPQTDDGGERLVVVEDQRWQFRPPAELVAAVRTGGGLHGMVEPAQPGDVAAHGARRHAEPFGELGRRPARAGVQQRQQAQQAGRGLHVGHSGTKRGPMRSGYRHDPGSAAAPRPRPTGAATRPQGATGAAENDAPSWRHAAAPPMPASAPVLVVAHTVLPPGLAAAVVYAAGVAHRCWPPSGSASAATARTCAARGGCSRIGLVDPPRWHRPVGSRCVLLDRSPTAADGRGLPRRVGVAVSPPAGR